MVASFEVNLDELHGNTKGYCISPRWFSLASNGKVGSLLEMFHLSSKYH